MRFDPLQFVLVLAVLAAAVALISGPLRAPRGEADDAGSHEAQADAAALEAAKEAKYREIREAELDFRTGKLSREDWEAVDRDLRSEALEILGRLDRLGADGDGAGGGGQPARSSRHTTS